MDEGNSFCDLGNLVRNYLSLSIDLAYQSLSIKDFYKQLYGRLSREIGIDEEFLEHITQPLANLHFFQNTNGRNESWRDSWIDFSNGRAELKEKPSDEEITKIIEPFLRMYGNEINNRLRNFSQH